MLDVGKLFHPDTGLTKEDQAEVAQALSIIGAKHGIDASALSLTMFEFMQWLKLNGFALEKVAK